MANVSLKTDFQNGDKLYDYELNNNFRAIKAALEAMNKITWQDDTTGVGVSAYKGNTEAIEARELIDGQLLYNTETGETYIDTYLDDVLTRINTGSGNVVAIQETEPENDAVKLWIEEDTLDTLGTEIVNEHSESTQLGYSADYINKNIVSSGSNENGNWIKYNDGTMITHQSVTGTVDITNEWYNLYQSSNINLPDFPVAFIDIPTVNIFSTPTTSTQYWMIGAESGQATIANPGKIRHMRPISGTAVPYKINITAIGRWK